MNKKLIKLLACSACGLGFASSIPFITTSCGCSQKEVDLPDEVYDFYDVDKKMLKGFTKEFLDDPNQYKDCNTMLIPRTVTKILDGAFAFNFSYFDTNMSATYNSPKIPRFLKTLKFANKNGSIDLGSYSFAFNSFENIYLPNSFIVFTENNGPFVCSQNLKHIYLNEKTQDMYEYSKSFGDECQAIVRKGQPFSGVVGGLATGFVDFTKDRKITQLSGGAFEGCSSITGYKFSNEISEIGINTFKFNTGLDVNKLSFENDQHGNQHYGFADNLGKDAKFLVAATEKDGEVEYKYDGTYEGLRLAAGDIDFTQCGDAKPTPLSFTSVSSVKFGNNLTDFNFQKRYDVGFLNGNKQLKSITFDNPGWETLSPKSTDLSANPNLKYIEFDNYSKTKDELESAFVLDSSNQTCFDYIGKSGTIKALECGFNSNELLEFFKSKTETECNPFRDWKAID